MTLLYNNSKQILLILIDMNRSLDYKTELNSDLRFNSQYGKEIFAALVPPIMWLMCLNIVQKTVIWERGTNYTYQ